MLKKTWQVSTAVLLFAASLSTFAQSADDTVSQRLQAFAKDANAASVNVALVKDGAITYSGAFGQANLEKDIDATTQHLYMIGSVSKLFTGTAAMQLVEKGNIELGADINEYLPFRLRNPKHPDKPITVEMLMRHESSIANMQELQNELYGDGDSAMSLEDLCYKVFDRKGEFYNESNFEDYQPGEKWGYRNWNYVLLGYIIERVSGVPYHEYSYKNVLEPLEMRTARWFFSDLELDDLAVHYLPEESGEHDPIEYYGWPGYPDGQLRANVRELSNLLIMYLNDGEFDGKHILSKDSISRMFTTKEYGELTGKTFKGMGLTWFVNAGYESVYSHGGSPTGTRIDVLIDTKSNSGFIFFGTGIDEMKIWPKIKGLLRDLQKYAAHDIR